MKPRIIPDPQDHLDGFFGPTGAEADANISLLAGGDGGIPVANMLPEMWLTPAVSSPDATSADGQDGGHGAVAAPSAMDEDVAYPVVDGVADNAASDDSGGTTGSGSILPAPAMPVHAFAGVVNQTFTDQVLANPFSTAGSIDTHSADAGIGGATATLAHDDQLIFVGPNAAASALAATASLAGGAHESSGAITEAAVGSGGATAAQVQQALDESGLSVNGTGIKVGVLSDSFNNLRGAANDEADGALPSASNVDVIKDLGSGGTDEGRAMMQIIHDIAPGASMAFYTASDGEQDFANGILALAAAGCKVIVDDESYFDEPFFQNGVVAQAIQTVEAEGVTYVTAAGNDASNAYQAAWSPISGTFDGVALTNAESFGGSLVQTITINTEGTGLAIPLLLEWNQAYGAATSDLEMLVFRNGSLVGTATNQSEPTNPWVGIDLSTSGTYQVAIENLSGPNPGLIKEVIEGDGLPATISGANSGTVVGHAMTPGAISTGAVSVADTPAFGFSTAVSESFSSSGAGTELLFANNGTALSSPDVLSPVAVSGVDDIATTVTGNLSDFYGTSAASASLAGVAALILAADPNLTSAQVEQIMEQTAAPMSNSAVSGAGLVQVDAAVAAAEALTVPSELIQTDGSTSLLLTGNVYYVDVNGSGQPLKYGGAPVTVGEFGNIAPIGTVQTASGFDIAWKTPGTDQLTFWSTDAHGNYTSNLTGLISGTTLAAESLETTFGQDLNGDGTIGPTSALIKTDGSTNLIQVADTYFVDVAGSGLELKYGGAPVTVGEFGSIAPIGAVQTASGYEIAWKVPGTDQLTFWSVDSNGNFTSNIYNSLVWGTSLAAESQETIFGQDLNGDGTIGPTSALIQTDGSTNLIQVADTYFVDVAGSGLELKYGGPAVTVGEFSNFTPVGAVQTATGYDIAWHMSGTNEFTFWTLDSNGNYTSNITNGLVSGSALASFETLFHQDFNDNGSIGSSATFSVLDGTAATASISIPEAFTGSNLTLGASSAFTGQIVGFAGDGTAQGSDQIDLRGISFNSIHSTYDSSTGVLAVTDGMNTTDIHFLGNYTQDNFKFASDGDGGSVIYAQTGVTQPSPSNGSVQVVDTTVAAGQETFVFAPNFGQATISNFALATDAIAISKTVFASVGALLAATRDDGHGNAVITDAAHDTITIQNVTTAQLQAHQSDFHIV